MDQQEEHHQTPYHTESLETCIRTRHSIRFFKPDPIPEDIFHECLALAHLAPSNSNIQNWRMSIASGAARDRIVAALSAEALAHGPNVPPLPEGFKNYRSEFGHVLYGDEGYGIKREEKERHRKAVMRNFEFFGAPLVGLITMHKDLTPVDAMSVGSFVQTLMLALTEQGIGCCLQVSVTGYPEVLRREFRLVDEQIILCGIAIGYPAEDNKVNTFKVPRADVDEFITRLTE